MDNFQSQIARIIAKVKGYPHGFLAVRVMESLNNYIKGKLVEEGRVLFPEQEKELSKKVMVVRITDNINELDVYFLAYEQMIEKLVDLSSIEMKFQVEKGLQEIFKEHDELLGARSDDRAEIDAEEKPKEKRGPAKILPFDLNREKGRH